MQRHAAGYKEHCAADEQGDNARQINILNVAACLRYDQLGIGYGNGGITVRRSVFNPCVIGKGIEVGNFNGDRNHLAVNVVAFRCFQLGDEIVAALHFQFFAFAVEENDSCRSALSVLRLCR